ncbi:MAG: outer membrane lipid asymmetry maintenance protein MlaD [Acetobacter sp.]|jgi:phospholipid/cholesterol/gamma-HCH transport system substrate-binding protein|nr:outer membrane lipid asymmetry maintenance protein MlaD [Acetobacter sp.]MCH4061864.1 outer membrane lipid asymmetry maintenance protein MlaD [Acetobacter sp.]MCH4089287.1 outer membrane lipid asymmetry maintenance protein MlaD [Acetobacter sp.]MCI1294481.1 outer membrane lipid asymmetry maintenance protein MlaD [Acetobacter sp.]MCI1321233.1 outer membrane lipid asymmetry maintenance protein MlaD [Acetobacter sp.]
MTTTSRTGGRPFSRSTAELLTGIATLAALGVFLILAVIGTDRKSTPGYQLKADFTHIDGLDVGSDVRMAGITVGQVVSETVDPKTFKAQVVFTVRPDLHLPVDSAAIITSDSLLGGKYIALSPGGDTKMLAPGGSVTETQGSISLEQLLSRFIFSVTDTLTSQNAEKAKAENGPGSP